MTTGTAAGTPVPEGPGGTAVPEGEDTARPDPDGAGAGEGEGEGEGVGVEGAEGAARQGGDPRYEHLTPLLERYASLPAGDPERESLRVQLVTGYLPVAQHIARRFAHRGEPLDDLVQVATVGLINAVDRFQPDRGSDFFSFAVPTISGEVRRHFRDQAWSMRVPRRLKDLHVSINAVVSELSQQLGRAPRPTEIAAQLDIPVSDVLEGLQASQAYRSSSLDEMLTSEQGSSTLGDLLGSADAELERVDFRTALEPVLAELAPRERTILMLRFFANMTQTQIADEVGISQMHVSRLLTQTLSRLRMRLGPETSPTGSATSTSGGSCCADAPLGQGRPQFPVGQARAMTASIRIGTPVGRWVLLATIGGSSLALLDSTVVNVALPTIGLDLGADFTQLQWIVNGYTLSLAALILLGGSLGDRFGRRRVFVVGTVWFALASVLCGLAPNAGFLIAARVLQGIGGALLTPGSLAIIAASFDTADRSRAVGAWSGLGGVAGAIGPFLGGALVEWTWRSVFLINVPIAIAVVVVTIRHVPESRDEEAAGRIDITGAALGVLGLGGLTYALTEIGSRGTDSGVIIAGVVGVAALVAFVVAERREAHPLIPLSMFANRIFTAVNVVTFLVYAGVERLLPLLVLQLQTVAGFPPTIAGMGCCR